MIPSIVYKSPPYKDEGVIRDENDRERSGKSLNHSRNHIFGPGTGMPDGKTKSVLRNIGNGIIRSGTCRI